MKIEIKSVQHFPTMSEETPCFTATVYLDGRKVATVINRGRGGCNEFSRVGNTPLPQETLAYLHGAELDIFTLVDEYVLVTKKQGQHLVLEKEGDYFTVKLSQPISKWKRSAPQRLALILQEYRDKKYQILNRNI